MPVDELGGRLADTERPRDVSPTARGHVAGEDVDDDRDARRDRRRSPGREGRRLRAGRDHQEVVRNAAVLDEDALGPPPAALPPAGHRLREGASRTCDIAASAAFWARCSPDELRLRLHAPALLEERGAGLAALLPGSRARRRARAGSPRHRRIGQPEPPARAPDAAANIASARGLPCVRAALRGRAPRRRGRRSRRERACAADRGSRRRSSAVGLQIGDRVRERQRHLVPERRVLRVAEDDRHAVAFYHPTAGEAAATVSRRSALQIPYLCQTDASHPVATLLRAGRDNDHRSTE